MRTAIANFTGAYSLNVKTSVAHHDGFVPALVSIGISTGPIDMQHSMTAEQARHMAAALLQGAEEIEAIEAMGAAA